MPPPAGWRLVLIQSTLLLPAEVKRSSAAQIATAIALDPPIPAPAGASESVVSVNPPCGCKNFTISASSGSLYRFTLTSSPTDRQPSSRSQYRELSRLLLAPCARVSVRQK